VSTPDGAAGLNVTDGRELLIGATPQEFADRVTRVVSDATLRVSLAQAGFAYLHAQHSEAIGRERLSSALSTRTNGSTHSAGR
jgi:hypothetical protein